MVIWDGSLVFLASQFVQRFSQRGKQIRSLVVLLRDPTQYIDPSKLSDWRNQIVTGRDGAQNFTSQYPSALTEYDAEFGTSWAQRVADFLAPTGGVQDVIDFMTAAENAELRNVPVVELGKLAPTVTVQQILNNLPADLVRAPTMAQRIALADNLETLLT